MASRIAYLIMPSLLLAIAGQVRATAPEQGLWRSDFETAQADAERLGRPIVVHFGAPWCGACRRMELQVLPDADVARQLAAFFVPVRVDTDERPDLAERFDVRSLPTDLILAPDGTVLARSEQALDQYQYLRQLAQAERRWSAIERQRGTVPAPLVAGEPNSVQPQAEPAPAPRSPAPRSPAAPSPAAPSPAPPGTGSRAGETVVHPALHPVPAASSVQRGPIQLRTLEAVVALDGYCPVTLAETHAWVDGDARYAAQLADALYVFAGPAERDRFLADPLRYVPWNGGRDPVLFTDYDYVAPGSAAYGAYYEGQLYLFANETTRQLFRDAPERYAARVQTASW